MWNLQTADTLGQDLQGAQGYPRETFYLGYPFVQILYLAIVLEPAQNPKHHHLNLAIQRAVCMLR